MLVLVVVCVCVCLIVLFSTLTPEPGEEENTHNYVSVNDALTISDHSPVYCTFRLEYVVCVCVYCVVVDVVVQLEPHPRIQLHDNHHVKWRVC